MIALLLGIPIPEEIKTSSFVTDNYWRVIFFIPIVIAIIQTLLIMTVFNYETPKYLKQNGK